MVTRLATAKKQGNARQFDGKCNYCKKKGHKERDCYKKKRDEKEKGSESANVAE